jgi:SAM-dependent methyltransferase
LIRSVAGPDSRIIDVGGGASTLVDDLLGAGFRQLTVLDISPAALEVARQRLGDRSGSVSWIAADVTTATLPEHAFDLWHDRAVLHFLTAESERARYAAQVRRALVPGGHVVVGTFALDGPAKCSGLDVVRYDAASLAQVFGHEFELTSSLAATHWTPAGREQRFLYCVLRRLD